MSDALAIFAGAGDLPRRLIEAARESGRKVFVVGFHDQTDPETLAAAPSIHVNMGSIGTIVRRCRAEGVSDIVMAGRIRRPSWREVRPDWHAARFIAKVGMKALGDDGLLRAVVKAFEDEGFRVIGPDQVLSSLLAPPGVLGRHKPDRQAETDIARGIEVARALGLVDVGQAVVVQQGLVLGIEAIEGTDALLARVGPLHRAGPGGVLVKLKKPQQDRRSDLPTIGLATLHNAIAAGLRGIAVEAGGSLMLDRMKLIEEADEAGIFVIGLTLSP